MFVSALSTHSINRALIMYLSKQNDIDVGSLKDINRLQDAEVQQEQHAGIPE